jgi:isocitrate dehydrogenase (NAD+)
MISFVKSLNKIKYQFSTQNLQKVVLFPGNGIGPEISQAVVDIFSYLKVPIEFEYHEIHVKGQTSDGDLISYDSLNALKNYKLGLKGPF